MEAFGFLPKEIMDMIGEYNVEHRPQMGEVFKEMHRKNMFDEIKTAKELKLLPFIDDSYECDNAYCEVVMTSDYFEENNFIQKDFIRTKALGYWFNFCCGECEYDNHRDIRRHYRSHPWDISYKSMLKFGEIAA